VRAHALEAGGTAPARRHGSARQGKALGRARRCARGRGRGKCSGRVRGSWARATRGTTRGSFAAQTSATAARAPKHPARALFSRAYWRRIQRPRTPKKSVVLAQR
jgi:hypothetical protein